MISRLTRLFLAVAAFAGVAQGQLVLTARVDGSINPAVSEYLHSTIREAEARNAACLVVYLDTPGGLLKSTRVIVSDFLTANVPVVVYVAPSGARAASAGVFITLASHIAAMAPGTNIGAAHPVTMQGEMDSVMSEKATNDAAAFVRTIAEKRQRNVAWAEDAVRKSISITETEALDNNVVDIIAKNLPDLLNQIDGSQVELPDRTVTLSTRDARIENIEMGWSEKVLDILSDPNIAYILLMLGVYGLLFELYNPGAILPGVVGVISLILGFYSLHTLPVNYAGLALILFGIVLFIAEIKVTSYGLLTVGGIVSLTLGSMMLIRSESALEFLQISWTVILAVVVISVLFFGFLIGFGLRAQRRKPTTGSEGMVGEEGEAITALDPSGRVQLHGEIWNAETTSGRIKAGSSVRVVAVRNLTLIVQGLQEETPAKGVRS